MAKSMWTPECSTSMAIGTFSTLAVSDFGIYCTTHWKKTLQSYENYTTFLELKK